MDWEKFIQDTYKGYYSIARSIVGEMEAEDVVWDTYAKLVESNYPQDVVKKTGLTVLRNTAINYYRDKKRHNLGIRISLQDLIYEIRNPQLTTHHKMDYDEVLNALWRVIPLPAMRCMVLYAMGYSYQEISDFYNMPMGTIKHKIHQGRKVANEMFPEVLG